MKPPGDEGMTVEDKYRFTRFEPKYKDQLLRLQEYLWGKQATLNRAYLDWKYTDNPYLVDPHIYLALHQEQVVGMRGFFGTLWEFGQDDQTINALVAADVVVHPQHRRRGLFRRLTMLALEDLAQQRTYSHVIALSSAAASTEGYCKMGWAKVGHWPIFLARGGPSDASSGAQPSLLVWAMDRLPWIGPRKSAPQESSPYRALDSVRSRGGPISITKAPRPSEMAAVVRRAGYNGSMRHVRDELYFTWRFRNPLSEYRFLFYDAEVLEGYLVLQRARARQKRGVNIVDWEGTSPEVKDTLLRAALEHGCFPNVLMWRTETGSLELAKLDEMGFVSIEEPAQAARHNLYQPMILLQPLEHIEPTAPGLLLRENWDLRGIYSDNF